MKRPIVRAGAHLHIRSTDTRVQPREICRICPRVRVISMLTDKRDYIVWLTSYPFVQVPSGFLLVTGAQRLAVGSVEEAVVVERRLPVPQSYNNKSLIRHEALCWASNPHLAE